MSIETYLSVRKAFSSVTPHSARSQLHRAVNCLITTIRSGQNNRNALQCKKVVIGALHSSHALSQGKHGRQ